MEEVVKVVFPSAIVGYAVAPSLTIGKVGFVDIVHPDIVKAFSD